MYPVRPKYVICPSKRCMFNHEGECFKTHLVMKNHEPTPFTVTTECACFTPRHDDDALSIED